MTQRVQDANRQDLEAKKLLAQLEAAKVRVIPPPLYLPLCVCVCVCKFTKAALARKLVVKSVDALSSGAKCSLKHAIV